MSCTNMLKIIDSDLSIFIEKYRYGIQTSKGQVILQKICHTTKLKSYYKYSIHIRGNDGMMFIYVEPINHRPYYLPLDRVY